MPVDCERELHARNVRRLMRILPISLAFGIVMTVYSLMTRSRSDGRFLIAISYYAAYAILSVIPLVIIVALGRRRARLATQNAVCFIALTCGQWLCIYQKAISGYSTEGYLVWTIANIVIIALFGFKPPIFLASMALQFATIVAYDSVNGMHQFLNLSVLVLVTVILAFTHWKMTIRDFRNVKALRAANEKSDELLRNILPPKVIDELREKGSSDPELFDQVSILFTDLVDFTAVSSSLPPEYIIGELSDLFSGFDCIIEKYGCTRIKTIGDAYMAVCGLPDPDPDHARKIVQAGLECLEYLRRRNEHSTIKWKMRVGAHSGSVVAGIVGARKYIYDIFGDTVNIASRMESSSNEMRVNVSEETYRRTKDHFSYVPREPQRVKGKGLMNMYFAESARAEPSA
ncbi:MAG TPA: adenylate/guanylate cyclase domain-containing protein [Treponemataceae bacterium]|nr:adenylate/guanylate cyclase domain-containing protein [Treponemataceae bacterium]